MPPRGAAPRMRNPGYITLSLESGFDTRRKRVPVWRTWHQKPWYLLLLGLVAALYTLHALRLRFLTQEGIWPAPLDRLFGPPSLVFSAHDLRRVWEWEVAAGHFPSSRHVPASLRSGFAAPLQNPARPPSREDARSGIVGTGPRRLYVSPKVAPLNVAYPPRPVQGGAADLDIIMEECDFSAGKYVRDCLKTLRIGAELDTGARRIRGSPLEQHKYIYVHDAAARRGFADSNDTLRTADNLDNLHATTGVHTPRAAPPLNLPPVPAAQSGQDACAEGERRVFHMFWTGPFTDKPYVALLSFLYTQNLGLHLPPGEHASLCRTELWVWVTQPRWARSRRDMWERRLEEDLEKSEWTRVFLSPRFREVVKFKVWDSVEQLDALQELDGEWRKHKASVMARSVPEHDVPEDTLVERHLNETLIEGVNLPKRASDEGAATYDKPAVALSDLVRFVLCHRYGGIYLDVDTVFLRDWEELWGWQGAFAYRWSRMDRYNTAVLRMHKGSALGTFLLRTGLKHGLKFHPIRIGRYLKDAQMEDMLLRLPDALFDPAWLNDEGYQVDRPPQPFLTSFDDFFNSPPVAGAAPEALGFDGFYRGAYSYHYHNKWWTPFDPARDYPDLGPRFPLLDPSRKSRETSAELSWSAVLKRTFEAYIRGEQPNMYGEWIHW